MLTIRKRGEIYYVRGTVRAGDQRVIVPERSTGFDKRKDAERYAARLTKEIQEERLNPNADRSDRTTFDDCLRNYLDKKRLKVSTLQKISVLVDFFEGTPVNKIADRWNTFCAEKRNCKLSTIARYLSQLNAIMNMANVDLKITPPKITKPRFNNEVIFLLTPDVREKLLSCYSLHAKPIFQLFSLQGFREQELLQLQWEDVHFDTHRIVIRRSKNGKTRSVPMHDRSFWVLARMWIKQGKPLYGHAILNQRGKPYTDSRITGGGSPIRKAHINALDRLKKEYGITLKMRVHDYRHDWAARMVMAGNNLLTVKKIGGWESMSMVERYATLTTDFEQSAINRI